MTNLFYRAFEDRYRGSRDLIKQRLYTYRPFLEALRAHYPGAAALDLGCGRGEWLEVLGEQGFAGRGVDLDAGMLAACVERGLDVSEQDALAALAALPDDSVAVVSAFIWWNTSPSTWCARWWPRRCVSCCRAAC